MGSETTVVTVIGKRRTGKKSKKPDNRPARKRYWSSRKLMANKVRNLVVHNGMNEVEAKDYWKKARSGRRMNDPHKLMQ
jgi:hypothetical protein